MVYSRFVVCCIAVYYVTYKPVAGGCGPQSERADVDYVTVGPWYVAQL